MRVLIVDDDATIRGVLKAIIRRHRPDAQVAEAPDAHHAFDEFERIKPDVVFLDMDLDGGPGGLYTLGLLKTKDPKTRVVLVTGMAASEPKVKAALSRGADGHLVKPVRAEDIKRALSGLD